MPCASYADPRLAAVYDTLNPPGADAAFYLDLAGDRPRTVLDMGCGTGRLACDLAARGHQVTGADPAPAMLDIARSRPGGDKVTWVEADAARLAVASRFDLVIMTGHVFQIFLDDETVRATLGNLSRHLARSGRIAFEIRNPHVSEWEQWRPEQTRERLDIPGQGVVDVHYDIKHVQGQFVTFETHFGFADGSVVAPHTLRFMSRDELAAFLAEAGFAHVAWYGDWDRSAFNPASPEIIVIAS